MHFIYATSAPLSVSMFLCIQYAKLPTINVYIYYIHRGASIYPHMSVIGNYFVFGTANMHNIPMRVQECLLNENITIENANVYDICGNDRSDNDLYRCLEDGVYANCM